MTRPRVVRQDLNVSSALLLMDLLYGCNEITVVNTDHTLRAALSWFESVNDEL